MDLRRLFCLPLALSCIGSAVAADVTIYRCTDAAGRLTLRDTPCRKGEHQQTRAMLRPSDPARRPIAKPAPAAPPTGYAPATRVMVVQAPRPLYECVAEDGERYTSDSAEGNLRWVPLPVLGYPVGYPVFPQRHSGVGRGVSGRLEYRDGPLLGRVELGRPAPPRPGYPPRNDGIGYGYGYGSHVGTWLRDACHALPQQEVCGRLSDRRYELDRQYNSALQSQRARITTEQRGIDARLSNDCGAY